MSSIRDRFLVTVTFLTVLIPTLTVGCRGIHNGEVESDEVETTHPGVNFSVVAMNDLRAEGQLKKGFSSLEAGAWRWTAGEFSVVLKTPPGARTSGGVLTFAFTIPGNQLPGQTLTASIGGTAIRSERYTQGKHTFVAEIPASLLTAGLVTVDFSVDHTLPPSPGDTRELGVIANSIGITRR